MAMARIDQTVDSRPLLMPDKIVVAGPVRVASAISCTGWVSVEVKYSVRRLTIWARTRRHDNRRPLTHFVAWSLPT